MSNPPEMALKSATAPIYFGSFLVTPQVCPLSPSTLPPLTNQPKKQVFYKTPLSFALVNLKPILPGHVLISPLRVVPRLCDLTPSETSDLFLTVRRVGRMVERVYGAASLNIAIQDGVHAGQSVPHVHAHILPRKARDLDHRGGTDAVYDMLDGEEGDIGRALLRDSGGATEEARKKRSEGFPVPDDEERKPRGEGEMVAEAEMLKGEMEGEPVE
ncbi:hypothetical protein N7478_008438 [Penicillium angulare]|uniref:uncharacterized protein n=1 Tax=Penicillium angulare TaxID=116970 RepID=UPI00253FB5D4|nr:uncharacterized protein N7478_008438 [Penicillium angulare]KAJ5273313.1 hypothetical protein N7478_008438 [Penicillium angulare]